MAYAKGDVVSAIDITTDLDAYYAITPGAGEEWIIRNVYHNGAAELYFTNGTTYILIDSDTAAGAFAWNAFNLTATNYLAIKQKATSHTGLGYDGICVKG